VNKVKFLNAKIGELSLAEELMREYFTFDGITWNRKTRSGLKLLLENNKLGQLTFIFSNDALAGYFIFTYGFDLEFGGLQVTVTDLYIRPKFRHFGLGTRTISFITKFCKEKKVKAVELQVEKHNKKARIFYKKMGFTVHDRIPLSMKV